MKIVHWVALSGISLSVFWGATDPVWGKGLFKWVDQEGRVHFGDQPVKGAQQIEALESLRYSPPPLPPRVDTPSSPPTAQGAYDAFEILFPKPEQTLQSTSGSLTVSLALHPPLQPGHRLEVSLDGSPLQGSLSTQFTLQGVPRGSHRLEARILDDKDQEISRTGPVTFHVHQPIVKPGNDTGDGKIKAPGDANAGHSLFGAVATDYASRDLFRAGPSAFSKVTRTGRLLHPLPFTSPSKVVPNRQNPFAASRFDYAPAYQTTHFFESRE
ncbi:hypothetical protein CCP4SC76_3500011 [Gammaproteobacteria bacterium]